MKPIHWLVIFCALCHVTLSAARMATSLHALQLDADPAVIGLLIALYGASAALASVPVGRLADRRPARPLILACLALLGGGTLLPFFWESLIALGIAGLLVGGGYFALYIINSNLAARYGSGPERAGNFALMHMSLSGANVVGPLVAGFGIDYLGHAHTFLLLALLPVGALALLLSGRLALVDELPPRRGGEGERGSLGELLRDPAIRPVYVMTVLFALLWDTFTLLAPIKGAGLDFSASRIGIVVSTFSFASFAVRGVTPLLARRFSNWQLLLLAISLGAGSCLAFGMSTGYAAMLVFAFGVGFGQGLGSPIGNAALFDVVPPHRSGEAMGLRTAVMMSCQTGMPLVAGAASSLLGVAPLFMLSGAVGLSGAWVYRRLWGSTPPSSSDTKIH